MVCMTYGRWPVPRFQCFYLFWVGDWSFYITDEKQDPRPTLNFCKPTNIWILNPPKTTYYKKYVTHKSPSVSVVLSTKIHDQCLCGSRNILLSPGPPSSYNPGPSLRSYSFQYLLFSVVPSFDPSRGTTNRVFDTPSFTTRTSQLLPDPQNTDTSHLR